MKERLFDLRKRGFNRLIQNGQVFEFSTPESLLDINFSEPVFGLVDRLVVAADQRARIVDAVEIGYREAGEVIFETAPRDGEQESFAAIPLFAALRVQERRHALRRAGASAVFVQQSLRGVSASARGLATRSISISIWSFLTRERRSTKARSSPGPSRNIDLCLLN